jgi:hypothetical protein
MAARRARSLQSGQAANHHVGRHDVNDVGYREQRRVGCMIELACRRCANSGTAHARA